MTDYQKTQIMKLRAEGLGYGRIAQQLGISLNTVKSYCRRNNVNGDIVPVNTAVPVFTARLRSAKTVVAAFSKSANRRKNASAVMPAEIGGGTATSTR